jgi:phosphoribosyl-ATP pyrophosphohydrolase
MGVDRSGAQRPRKDLQVNTSDNLARLQAVLESRKPANGGDPETSYVARLFVKGPDAFLKKVGEEATEFVMASKDLSVCDALGKSKDELQAKLVGEAADLWFHSMVALAHHGLTIQDVVAELSRREGLSGLDEKALRKVREREATGE